MRSLYIKKDGTVSKGIPMDMFAGYAEEVSMLQVACHTMIVIDDIKSINFTADSKADVYLHQGHAFINMRAGSKVRVAVRGKADTYIHAPLDQNEPVISSAPISCTEEKMDQRLADWLANGDRGASSEAMCKHFFGVPVDAGKSHPYDPSDFQRCIRFLDATQSHDMVPTMAIVSLEWGLLANNWAELSGLYEQESSQDTAPLLYERMKELLDSAREDKAEMRP